MATPLEVDDLPLLQMTLTTQEIIQLCRPWLDFQQNMLLSDAPPTLLIREEALKARLPAVLMACKRHLMPWSYTTHRAVEYVNALETLAAQELLGTLRAYPHYQEFLDEISHMQEGLMRRVPVEFEDRTWVRLAVLAVDTLTPRTAGVFMLDARKASVLKVLDTWLRV